MLRISKLKLPKYDSETYIKIHIHAHTTHTHCRVKDACPLNGNCLTNSVIYNCNVKDNNNDTGVNYIGLTEHTFKDRFYKHRSAFKYKTL